MEISSVCRKAAKRTASLEDTVAKLTLPPAMIMLLYHT